jgi:hypothetical protein
MKAKMNNHQTPISRPFSRRLVMRLLVLIIIASSLIAGYYAALYQTENKKYRRLEDMYVRVRGQLGREETQRLIDLSHEQESQPTDW